MEWRGAQQNDKHVLMPKLSCANHHPERKHMQRTCLQHWAMWKRMGSTRGCGMLWSVPSCKFFLTAVLWLVAHLSVPRALCCSLGPGTSPSRPPNKCMWHREHGPKRRMWWASGVERELCDYQSQCELTALQSTHYFLLQTGDEREAVLEEALLA